MAKKTYADWFEENILDLAEYTIGEGSSNNYINKWVNATDEGINNYLSEIEKIYDKASADAIKEEILDKRKKANEINNARKQKFLNSNTKQSTINNNVYNTSSTINNSKLSNIPISREKASQIVQDTVSEVYNDLGLSDKLLVNTISGIDKNNNIINKGVHSTDEIGVYLDGVYEAANKKFRKRRIEELKEEYNNLSDDEFYEMIFDNDNIIGSLSAEEYEQALIETAAHETRHHWQQEQNQEMFFENESIDPSDYDKYYDQVIEEDARKYAEDFKNKKQKKEIIQNPPDEIQNKINELTEQERIRVEQQQQQDYDNKMKTIEDDYNTRQAEIDKEFGTVKSPEIETTSTKKKTNTTKTQTIKSKTKKTVKSKKKKNKQRTVKNAKKIIDKGTDKATAVGAAASVVSDVIEETADVLDDIAKTASDTVDEAVEKIVKPNSSGSFAFASPEAEQDYIDRFVTGTKDKYDYGDPDFGMHIGKTNNYEIPHEQVAQYAKDNFLSIEEAYDQLDTMYNIEQDTLNKIYPNQYGQDRSYISYQDFDIDDDGNLIKKKTRHQNRPEMNKMDIPKESFFSRLDDTPMKKAFRGVNLIANTVGTVSVYKDARRKGHSVVSSAVRAGVDFAVGEALGGWVFAYEALKHVPTAAIKGTEMLYKENRRMNAAANNQVFGNAQFADNQQLATMRQSGLEMAKMSQYNLQQTLLGSEAKHLHR